MLLAIQAALIEVYGDELSYDDIGVTAAGVAMKVIYPPTGWSFSVVVPADEERFQDLLSNASLAVHCKYVVDVVSNKLLSYKFAPKSYYETKTSYNT